MQTKFHISMNWDMRPEDVGLSAPPPVPPVKTPPHKMGAASQSSSVEESLAMDKERLRKAALKNLEYMRKKEIREIQLRLAQTEENSKVTSSSDSNTGRRAKRARISRAGVGCTIQNTSVYVMNLPHTADPALLEKLFSTCGRVRKVKLYRNPDGTPKGDALVTYIKSTSAAEATRQLNGKTYPEGETMSVKMADFERKEAYSDDAASWTGQYGMGAGLGYSSSAPEASLHGGHQNQSLLEELKSKSVLLRKVFCPELARSAAGYLETIQADIEVECGRLGRIQSIDSLVDGSFLLKFETEAVAERCIELMHGRWFDERQIIADYFSSAETKRPPCRSVILRKVFTDEQAANNPEFLKELENDFGSECSKAGPISHIECVKGGSISITYESTISAASCIDVMNGRYFDERQIVAEYDYDSKQEQKAEATTLTKLEDVAVETDDEAKLQRFLAFVQ